MSSVKTTETTVDAKSARRWLGPVLALLILATAVILARSLGLGERLAELREWIASLGSIAPLAFIGVYVLATVLAVPGVALTFVGGGVFGTLWGSVYISIASTIGASLCFLIARYAAGEGFRERMRSSERFRRLQALTEEHGHLVVAVTRLTPIFPFNLLNYGFGLTGVRFWTYVFWSWLCMLPGTVVYVSGADLWAQITTGNLKPETFVVLGLAVLILVLIVHRVRRDFGVQRPTRTSELRTWQRLQQHALDLAHGTGIARQVLHLLPDR